MRKHHRQLVVAITIGLITIHSAVAQSIGSFNSNPIIDCDRACLYGFVDLYLDALVDKKPHSLPLTPRFKFTENNVQLPLGDGLWGTISGRRDYNLRFADPSTGQVGFFGVVEEHGIPAIYAMRMKIENKRLSEVETVLSRRVDDGPFPRPDLLIKPEPVFSQVVPQSSRKPRARLISIADGYFDTLQLNDGQLFTYFDERCNRRENGLQTTNNPEAFGGEPLAAMGCEAQFKTGNFFYDDELRDRRHLLVDEELGLVLSGAFIDHSGRVGDYQWTDGTPQTSHYTSPHSYVLLELFKIVDGKIRQIEAVFFSIPYGMKSPWVNYTE